MEPQPGATVAGRYRIERRIGSGGMGEVWAGESLAIGARVALKTLLPEAAKDRQIVARFRREAQLLGRVRSERVARVIDFVDEGQAGLWLVMDYVEGEALGEVLLTRRLGIEEAIDVGVDLLSALADLHHAKVVHRDLKPDNVILEPVAGGRRRAVIVDLGVGRVDEADPGGDDSVTSITHVDTAVGTLPYMAPEQLLSSRTATAAADVYAAGAILYRAVSGEQVFTDPDDAVAARQKLVGEAPPLSLARVDRVARGFAAVVAQALRRDPDKRFPSADAMLRELEALQDVAHATALDLDATTEEAFPISSLAFATSLPSLSGPPTEAAPPPVPIPSGAPATVPSPTAEAAPDTTEDGTGEPTRVMARSSFHSFDDEATQLSPASQSLPRAPASSLAESEIADPLTTSSPSLARPTVVSPSAQNARTLAVPVAPLSLRAPSSIAAPPTVDEPPAPRTVPLRAAVVALLAALALGGAIGFEAHRALSSPAAQRGP